MLRLGCGLAATWSVTVCKVVTCVPMTSWHNPPVWTWNKLDRDGIQHDGNTVKSIDEGSMQAAEWLQ